MSSRMRMFVIVMLLAAVAGTVTVEITMATRHQPEHRHVSDIPPVVPPNLPTPYAAKITAAFKPWSKESITKLQVLAAAHPKDPLVQLYLGLALVYQGYSGDAVPVLRTVLKKGVGYDTPYEIAAENYLHPEYFSNGYPLFQPISHNSLLSAGAGLQRIGRQHSAEALYLKALKRQPNNVEAQVAAAVGAFNMDNIGPAFGRLGPMTAKYPNNQLVQFYLGLMLAWIGHGDTGVTHLQKTVDLGPNTTLGREAKTFLDQIRQAEAANSGSQTTTVSGG